MMIMIVIIANSWFDIHHYVLLQDSCDYDDDNRVREYCSYSNDDYDYYDHHFCILYIVYLTF